MTLEFIQEISEARLFKNSDTLKGKSVTDIGKITFLSIMMMEIIRNHDNRYAIDYAKNTRSSNNFSAMNPGKTDLHNLLVVLTHQDKFSDKIKTDSKIFVPMIQLKHYLNNIEVSCTELDVDRRMLFKKLEDGLLIKDNSLKHIRRAVADWDQTSKNEREVIYTTMKQLANSLAQQNDLYQYFKNSSNF